jgi:pimeloyl-ACP methyl ester carboxylesterase
LAACTSSHAPGHPPAGLPAADGTCADPGRNTPILFVHGLNGSPADFTGRSPSLASTLAATPGVTESFFDYAAASNQWVTDPRIGPALARDIACLADRSKLNGGPGKVIVVAHSMGGLALRQAASDTVGTEAVATRIGLAVTIATPNTGSWIDGLAGGRNTPRPGSADATTQRYAQAILNLATTICGSASPATAPGGPLTALCGLVAEPASPAAQAMVPGSDQLSALPALPAAIPLYAVAGNIRLQTVTPLVHTRVDVPVQVGDLLVRPDSALAEAGHPGTGSGTFTANCDMSVSQLTDGHPTGWPGCTHGGLLYDPGVSQAVAADVRAYLAAAGPAG